jgi:hypothetical protein
MYQGNSQVIPVALSLLSARAKEQKSLLSLFYNFRKEKLKEPFACFGLDMTGRAEYSFCGAVNDLDSGVTPTKGD